MNYNIKCNGQEGGAYFFLNLSEGGDISLVKTKEEASSFIIANVEDFEQTFYAQGTRWYLGWELSSESPKAYDTPNMETRWYSKLGVNPTPMRAFTSQKEMFLDGLTLTGQVQLVDTISGPYTGTRWTAEPSF